MLEQLKKQFEAIVAPAALQSLRNKGWSQFEQLGFPSKKSEAYRYIPMRELSNQQLQLSQSCAVPSSSCAHPCRLVFVNGFFCSEFSELTALPKQVQVMPLSAALSSHPAFLQQRITKAIKEECDPFAALNAAIHGEGVFVYVPPKLVLEQPIHCVHIHTDPERMSSPRIHLFVGKESHVDWITTSEGHLGHCNGVFDIALEEGAGLRLSNQIVPGEKRWHFEALRATLKTNSRLHSVSFSSGKGYARQDYGVVLAGEGAEAQLFGLTVLEGKSHGHAHIRVEHAAPHTQSMQRFKTLLHDMSQSSFEGKIVVRQEAQKTQAYQLNNNLLLDDRAIANSKPNLEIFADDVKASHGVTVSQLDANLLFYLKTRGVAEDEAKKLLTQGFCQEILQEIAHPFLAQQIQKGLNDVSHGKN